MATSSFSQTSLIEFTYGTGSYQMTDMKKFNEALVSNFPFPTAITSSYPDFQYFKGSLMTQLAPKLFLGASYSFHSTGSRISARDYTAEFFYDNLLKSSMIGIQLRQSLLDSRFFQVFGQVESGATLSTLMCKEYFKLFDTVQINSKDYYKALQYYLEPTLGAAFKINSFRIGCNAGYMFQLGKKGFHKDDSNKSQVINPATHQSLKPEWDGFRFSLSLSFSFSHPHSPASTSESN